MRPAGGSTATPGGSVASPDCASSISAAAAASCASRWRGSAPPWWASIRAQANIAAARLHAAEGGLAIDYRAATVEALADAGERFDVVLAMEVVEHVADVGLFVRRCAEMVKPGGLMIAATLNRTLKSFALAIVGAEYVLRWLPRGTHRWDKFVTPNELEIALDQGGLRLSGETGVIYHPLADRWQLSSDMDVNYMLTAEKAPSSPQPTLGPQRLQTFRTDQGSKSMDYTFGVGFELALGRLHHHRRCRADRAQCRPARADRHARHGGRDPCAVPVRLSVRAADPRAACS